MHLACGDQCAAAGVQVPHRFAGLDLGSHACNLVCRDRALHAPLPEPREEPQEDQVAIGPTGRQRGVVVRDVDTLGECDVGATRGEASPR